MGINYLIFGDVDSRDFNIEVFFSDIDRTPKRVYESVEIPSRNGAFLIDTKRYEDMPVAYGCIALDDEDRKEFVNALASSVGYHRMEDSFNNNEFYSAVFDGDVEPHITPERDKSVFTIHFTRKPQRWLKSGETAVSVTSGDMLTNPTRFDASPLLEVEGYGNVHIGGYDVNLANTVVGHVSLLDSTQGNTENVMLPLKNASLVNQFDEIAIGQIRLTLTLKYLIAIRSVSVTDSNPVFTSTATVGVGLSTYVTIETVLPSSATVFDIGEFFRKADTITITAVNSHNETITTTLEYILDAWIGDPSDSSYFTISKSDLTTSGGRVYEHSFNWLTDGISAESTKDFLGHPTYIDCDLGIAYRIDNEEVTSLDAYIDLGSDLPSLSPGANEVTFDNAITSLDIVPRWWKI